MRLFPCIAGAVVLGSLALAPAASAQDFCVGSPVGCVGTNVSPSLLKSTLVGAATNQQADRFFLGAGTFGAGPYAYDSDESLEIIGAGPASTLITNGAGGLALDIDGPATTVRDLGVRGTQNTPVLAQAVGTMLRNLNVTAAPGVTLQVGLRISMGARLEQSTVTIANYTAVTADDGAASIADSTLTGDFTAASTSGVRAVLKIERTTLKSQYGAYANDGRIELANSVIDQRGHSDGVGVIVSPGSVDGTAGADVDHVTMIAGDTTVAKHRPLTVSADATETASATLRNAIVVGYRGDISRIPTSKGTTSLSVSYINRPDALGVPFSAPFSEDHRVDLPTNFVDVAGGDFGLAPGSPLIDAGDPADLGPNRLDFRGQPRLRHGDLACTPVTDLGAVEYQPSTAWAKASATPTSVSVSAPANFTAAGSCGSISAEELSYQWRFDDGGSAQGPAVAHAFALPGTHVATLEVTDVAGHAASASAAVVVTGASTGGDLLAPTLTKLSFPKSIVGRSFLPALAKATKGKKGKLKGKIIAPTSTAKRPGFGFTLNEPGRVRLTFALRKSAKKLKPIKGAVSLTAPAGPSLLLFGGRLDTKTRLRPGRYVATITATDAAGNVSPPQVRSFRVGK